ncbi:MAG: DUF3822 family protein [Bacteroidales bacterium]|nr:DUF3822 family protein [Bacteroidales bacterium]MBS3774798.1 DUF3822 family protein [Bacteroidales bacterium]
MRDFSFVDETIDLNRAHSYRLSIQFSLNGFSFSILDLIRGKYVALKHTNLEQEYTPDQKAEKIQEIFNSDPCLQVGYKKVMVLVVTPKSVLIPASYFKQKDLIQYFKFNYDLQELDEIHFNYLQDIEAYNIFSIPNPVSNVITAKFNNAQFYQQGLPLISYYINSAHGDNTCSALSINEDFIDIAVLNRSRLHLYNSYYWSAYDDIIYYLLYVYKQLNLEVSENELHVNGDMENRKELKNMISQYLKKIHYHKPPSEFTYSYTFTKDKSHHFTNLFRLNLCV